MFEAKRICALCGVEVPSQHGDAGCPLIEAFGIVLVESMRTERDFRGP
jgi:hypothetical protein